MKLTLRFLMFVKMIEGNLVQRLSKTTFWNHRWCSIYFSPTLHCSILMCFIDSIMRLLTTILLMINTQISNKRCWSSGIWGAQHNLYATFAEWHLLHDMQSGSLPIFLFISLVLREAFWLYASYIWLHNHSTRYCLIEGNNGVLMASPLLFFD